MNYIKRRIYVNFTITEDSRCVPSAVCQVPSNACPIETHITHPRTTAVLATKAAGFAVEGFRCFRFSLTLSCILWTKTMNGAYICVLLQRVKHVQTLPVGRQPVKQ